MAFAFYLRNEADFRQFYWLMKRGKERYGSNWPFSLMDIKVMDKYFEEYREKQSSITMNFKIKNFMEKEEQEEKERRESQKEAPSLIKMREQKQTEDDLPTFTKIRQQNTQ